MAISAKMLKQESKHELEKKLTKKLEQASATGELLLGYKDALQDDAYARKKLKAFLENLKKHCPKLTRIRLEYIQLTKKEFFKLLELPNLRFLQLTSSSIMPKDTEILVGNKNKKRKYGANLLSLNLGESWLLPKPVQKFLYNNKLNYNPMGWFKQGLTKPGPLKTYFYDHSIFEPNLIGLIASFLPPEDKGMVVVKPSPSCDKKVP